MRAISAYHQIVRWEKAKVSESLTMARKRESEREHGEQRVDFTVKKGRFQGGDGGQAEKTFPLEVGESTSG